MRESEITPDPIRIDPAINPDAPAVMSSMLLDARYRKLATMPSEPAIIKIAAKPRQTS
jgi:hypothetical protein